MERLSSSRAAEICMEPPQQPGNASGQLLQNKGMLDAVQRSVKCIYPKNKHMQYSGEKMLKVNSMHLALMQDGDGDSPDIVLDVIHWHQPREEGLIWSYVMPVSHFLFYCCTATSEPPLCGQQLSNCLLLPR